MHHTLCEHLSGFNEPSAHVQSRQVQMASMSHLHLSRLDMSLTEILLSLTYPVDSNVTSSPAAFFLAPAVIIAAAMLPMSPAVPCCAAPVAWSVPFLPLLDAGALPMPIPFFYFFWVPAWANPPTPFPLMEMSSLHL